MQDHKAWRISIHAPAKGATLVKDQRKYSLLISIHAPAKGATGARQALTVEELISIHAPATGATVSVSAVLYFIQKFQSTLPRRERRPQCRNTAPVRVFQSTLPRRERLALSEAEVASLNFNPRSREGSDRASPLPAAVCSISIHAPAKGATWQ